VSELFDPGKICAWSEGMKRACVGCVTVCNAMHGRVLWKVWIKADINV
jgi:hypothetical protein